MNRATDVRDETRSADRVAQDLRAAIVDGRVRPGVRLKDSHLAVDYGVSRNTMRDALKQLEIAGLVTARLHSGAAVRVLDEDAIREIYRVRHVLEGSAIRASSRASDERLAGLADPLQRARAALGVLDWDAINASALRFHFAVVGLLDSQMIDSFFQNTLAQLRLSFGYIPTQVPFHERWVEWDEAIAELIHSGHRERAARAMSAYLDESEALIIDLTRAGRED